MRPISDINDPRLVKALAHPLRVRILSVLEQRTASPSELAEELGAPLGNVSYHFRMLSEFGLIKLVRRTPRRGAIEHHYEAIGRLQISDRAWGQAPDVIKEAFVGAILGQVGDYVNRAAADGGFDRAESHVTRSAMTLDAAGWRQLSRELMAFYERAQAIHKECGERLAGADHDGEMSVGLVLMLFEGQDFSAAPAAGDASQRATGQSRRRRASVS